MFNVPSGIFLRGPIAGTLLCALLFCLTASAVYAATENVPVPLGLPPLGLGKDSSTSVQVVEFGRRLFSDKRLSADRKISCSNCHDPNRGFSDGRDRAIGYKGRHGTRNAPSLFNVAYQQSLFWDGRAASLEDQAEAPLTNRSEHALANERQIIHAIQNDPLIAALYSKTFTGPIVVQNIATALASYERTLLAGNSPFDRYYYGGDKGAISSDAVRGLGLFTGRARCSTCHLIEDHYALFIDQKFHPLTMNLPSNVDIALPELTQQVLNAKNKRNRDLDQLITDNPKIAALGRFNATLNPADIGKFKTPSLRNVAITAPYMHDGSVQSLNEAIELELYVRGEAASYPIALTVDERKDLLAFLRSLTSPALDQ